MCIGKFGTYHLHHMSWQLRKNMCRVVELVRIYYVSLPQCATFHRCCHRSRLWKDETSQYLLLKWRISILSHSSCWTLRFFPLYAITSQEWRVFSRNYYHQHLMQSIDYTFLTCTELTGICLPCVVKYWHFIYRVQSLIVFFCKKLVSRE